MDRFAEEMLEYCCNHLLHVWPQPQDWIHGDLCLSGHDYLLFSLLQSCQERRGVKILVWVRQR